MAKLTKKLVEAFRDEAAKTVFNMETEEQARSKGGVFTKRDIEAIADEKAKEAIKLRYEAYTFAANDFNQARKKMAVAKYNLQSALDGPFATLGLITKSKEWNILGLDGTDENIVYRDSPGKSYQVRYERNKGPAKGSVKATERDETWQQAWDLSDTDIPPLEEVLSQGISQGTSNSPQGTLMNIPSASNGLPHNFDDDMEGYIKAYRMIKGHGKGPLKLEWVRLNLNEDEVSRFFDMLTYVERKQLYSLLNEDEKELVEFYQDSDSKDSAE